MCSQPSVGSDQAHQMELFDLLFRSEDVENVFSSRASLQGMLDFEAALARAEARAGVIPSPAAVAIAAKCKAELFDVGALARGAKLAGNLAIPLVKALTTLVAQSDKDAARYVHWGATSQDAIDTGCVLQLRQALKLIRNDLDRLTDGLAGLAKKHRSTIVVGRTWMQQALPTTFGAKVAGWLDALGRHRERLPETQRRALVLQFGGAVGTLAALGTRGPEVAKILAEELGLGLPDLPWHSHRDRIAEVATTLGLCVGTLGKIARDVALHAQTEIGEVFEPLEEGRGGSSTMPHKRNPVASAVVLAAALRVPGLVSTMLAAMVQEEERGLGGWHAEWETLQEIVRLSAGALHQMADVAPRLEVDVERMRTNLEVTRGLIYAEAVTMALAEKMGKAVAHQVVEAACGRAQQEKRHLRDVLSENKDIREHLPGGALDGLFDARKYLGAAEDFVDRAVARSSATRVAAAER
jgi:3-carboxy-cis,cis-muconate cycloisomerase